MKIKILLAISIGLILLSACSKEEEQVVKEEIPCLEDEEAENAFYQMFYGEWEITECVYLDKIPVRGVEYTEEEILEVSQEILAGAWKKIQFTRDRIVIDDNQMWETVRYNIIIFPSDNDYMLHFTMKLQDIGITEEAGKYYVLVEVEGEERGKITFFVKDEDTIIVYKNSYCIEYRRISFEGGNQEPAIILGSYMNGQIMEKNGYVFSRPNRTMWSWIAQADGVREYMQIYDGNGKMDMHIVQGARCVFRNATEGTGKPENHAGRMELRGSERGVGRKGRAAAGYFP